MMDARSLRPHSRGDRAPLSSRWRCDCSPAEAAAWLNDIAGLALAGDRDAQSVLSAVAHHYITKARAS